MLERVSTRRRRDFVDGAQQADGAGQRRTSPSRRAAATIRALAHAGRFDLTDSAARPAVIPVSLSPELPEHRPAGETTFVYGGVFLPWQDPARALTTLVETLEAHGQGRLHLFGGGHPIFHEVGGGEFPRLQARLERSPRVAFQPFIPHDELLRHYARAHVAIDLMARNPERELAFTTRTVEYLWCGLPVIYNNYSELSDYIRDYEAGWTLDPEDTDGLRAVIETILREPRVVEARSRNAQRLVRERLTWDRTIEPLDRFVRRPRLRAKQSPFLARLATPRRPYRRRRPCRRSSRRRSRRY
jgi:glycosyltransferase involved in cell wall biosynthesis